MCKQSDLQFGPRAGYRPNGTQPDTQHAPLSLGGCSRFVSSSTSFPNSRDHKYKTNSLPRQAFKLPLVRGLPMPNFRFGEAAF